MNVQSVILAVRTATFPSCNLFGADGMSFLPRHKTGVTKRGVTQKATKLDKMQLLSSPVDGLLQKRKSALAEASLKPHLCYTLFCGFLTFSVGNFVLTSTVVSENNNCATNSSNLFGCNFPVQNCRFSSHTNFAVILSFVSSRTELCKKTLPCQDYRINSGLNFVL